MPPTNKKKKSSGSGKTKAGVPKVNPFELKFNRTKHDILGKKKSSIGVGHPGLSRKRAYEQREKTLGVEHERVGKVNKIVDKRIGEKDSAKTAEERASLRFTAERMKNFKKANKFNLVDDEEALTDSLTHGGKSLTSVQRYERTLGSDDDDDEPGNIGADIVKMAHFGGGDFDQPRYGAPEKASRKDLIADLIARTKQVRQDKQSAKDEQETVTENLDDKYHKLLGKVQTGFRPIGATKDEKEKKDDYDKLALMLKIDADARATPAERSRTDEEAAAEDKEKLEEMESLRVARMNAQKNKRGHMSADLDVNPGAENMKKKAKANRFEVRFDEQGRMMEQEKVEKASIKKVAIDSDDELTDEDEEEDENEEDLDDLLNSDDGEGEEMEADDEDEEEESEMEDEEDDLDEDEEEEEETENVKSAGRSAQTKTVTKNVTKAVTKKSESLTSDIPFVFEMPKKFDALVDLLNKYGSKNVETVVERLVKCHHPGLKEGNKKLIARLFLYLLRFYDDTARKSQIDSEAVSMLGQLIKAMYSIMKFDVEYGVRCVRALIRQNWKQREGKSKRAAPSFGLIALLRLVAALYPVSDVWHPVCTPTMALAAAKLADCNITSLTVLARQVLLATTVADYVEESKRYVPEVVAFLRGALLMAVENGEADRAPTNAFPVSMPHKQMLYVEEALSTDADVPPLRLSEVFQPVQCTVVDSLEDTPLNRCRCLRALVAIIQKMRLVYVAHEHSFTSIFIPFVSLLKRIPLTRLPCILADEIVALTRSMEAECKSRARLTQLSQVKTEKSMVKMLEPCFEENFDPERPRMSRDANRQGSAAEKKKLQHLYKKEMRGAIKELRKDNVYISRKQRKEGQEKDRDRMQKTKRLMQGLQSQQGEWNKEQFDSGKKKKK